MKILALDLGTNSVGWALLNISDTDGDIVAMNSRIFDAPIEPKTKVPLNAKRRSKRLLRRVIRRRAQRKEALERLLRRAGLLPDRGPEFDTLFNDHSINPFLLRRKALDSELTPFEFGRALFHLGLHRGFKSNRKAMLSKGVNDPDIAAVIQEEEEKSANRKKGAKAENGEDAAELEEGQVLKAISELRETIAKEGARTLGEHLANSLDRGERARRTGGETANYDRDLVADEFEKVWEAQRQFNPALLTDKLKAEAHRIIFFQRPLKIQRFLISDCTLERGRKRASKALMVSQRFRILQDLNNLKTRRYPTEEWQSISAEQKGALFAELEMKTEMSWKDVRKVGGINKTDLINFEDGGMKKLDGSSTFAKMAHRLGETWVQMSSDKQDELVHDILHVDDLNGLLKRLRSYWGFTAAQAYKTATVDLGSGQMKYSAKALRKILPLMWQGMRTDEAVRELYGSDAVVDVKDELGCPPDMRNPVVNRTLNEFRGVVNAVLKKYGRPDKIRIELAREMKMSKKDKEELVKVQKENERLNAEAKEMIRDLDAFKGGEPSRDDLVKYRLWKESDQQCPYTGKCIELADLYGPDVDVEHILPFSWSQDDSYRNKTICNAAFNRSVKKNQTPKQCMDEVDYGLLLQRVGAFSKMAKGKKRLFEFEHRDDDESRFLSRMLVDTQYASRAAREYAQTLGSDISVEVGNGKITSTLRRLWGLNTLLGTEEKNRNDHRHHAVDACVIGLTSVAFYQRASRFTKKHGKDFIGGDGIEFPCPITAIREKIESRIKDLVVSHRIDRKIAGALHEETAYGRISPGVYVYRKAVTTLTKSEIERVRDPHLRKMLLAIGESELKKRDPFRPVTFTNKYGVEKVVRTVRLTTNKSDQGLLQIGEKYYPAGSNHHVEVFENSDGERSYKVVSTFEALSRARTKKPVYPESDGKGGRLIMAWHKGDTVEVEGSPDRLYTVEKFSVENPLYLVLAPTSSAQISSEETKAPSSVKAGQGLRLRTRSDLANLARVLDAGSLGPST